MRHMTKKDSKHFIPELKKTIKKSRNTIIPLILLICIIFLVGKILFIDRDMQRGGHQVSKLEGRVILTIGDSNGIVNGGWPSQLKKLLNGDSVFNRSTGGLTIGFDNCFKPEWNALKNVETYLKWAHKRSQGKPIDEVIILLGTNDCKTCFDDRKEMIAPNLVKFIHQIRKFDNLKSTPPHITIVTPPPYAPDSLVLEKALGGDRRVQTLIPQFLEVALKYHCGFINIYDRIKSDFSSLVSDHVHLTREGHEIVAQKIARVLNDRESPEPPSHVVMRGQILEWVPSFSDDVIGYEIIRKGSIVRVTTDNKIKMPAGLTELSVRARDGYGNVSIGVRES